MKLLKLQISTNFLMIGQKVAGIKVTKSNSFAKEKSNKEKSNSWSEAEKNPIP